MNTQSASLLIATLALLISLAGYLANLRNSAQSRTSLLQSMREDWQDESENWALALICARGVDDAYIPASKELRESVLNELDIVNTHPPFGDPDWALKHSIQMGARERYSQAISSVLDFLTLAADLVLVGDLDPADLYSFLGPQTARHHYAIRVMVGAESPRGERLVPQNVVPGRFQGRTERVLALTDLLCAEMARRGDLHSHQLAAMASHKQETRSGIYCRRRIRKLARHRHIGFTWWLRIRLQIRLLDAEFLNTRLLTHEWGHLAWGTPRAFKLYDWRSRYFKALLKGILSDRQEREITRAIRALRTRLGITHESPSSDRRRTQMEQQIRLS